MCFPAEVSYAMITDESDKQATPVLKARTVGRFEEEPKKKRGQCRLKEIYSAAQCYGRTGRCSYTDHVLRKVDG